MAIYIGSQKPKFYLGDQKVKAIWLGGVKVYSAGNIVTYHVDTGITYQEEVDEGASCLSPKTFTPAKSGWTFVGWRSDASANANVHQSLVMGDDPVVLYAVFRQAVTVTYYNGSTAASSTSGYRYYNSGNIANPSFTLTQAALSGWSARGWSASGAADGGIAYANGVAFTRDSSITLYGMYQQTIALTTVANGSSSTQYGTRYYNSNGNIVNPVFTVSTPSLSGANWLGWCNSVGTVLYSSISNLALSASTTLYSKVKYADSGVIAVNKYIQFGSGGAESGQITGSATASGTYTYPMDTSKYDRNTVVASCGTLMCQNNTTGTTRSYAYVNGVLVRERWNPNWTDKKDEDTGNHPGTNGKQFTVSGNGAPVFTINDGSTWHGGGQRNNFYVTSVQFFGKTVIG